MWLIGGVCFIIQLLLYQLHIKHTKLVNEKCKIDKSWENILEVFPNMVKGATLKSSKFFIVFLASNNKMV